jgi:hypothetical protein
VELELVTEQGFPLTGSRDWIDVFKNQDVQLRIRTATPGDRVEIVNRGTDNAPVYHVRGLLTRQNTLVVPGGRFTPRDRAQIAAWIDKLRRGGLDPSGGARPSAFGLTAEELVSLHESLAVRVPESTKGGDPKAVVRQIASRIRARVVVDPAASGAFAEGGVVYDELLGVSCGTALAAVVRPLGLVIVPTKTAGEIQLSIVDSRKATESWPIGWPPQKKERELVPKLYEFLPVEIEGALLSEALQAVRERLNVPMLFDQNAMARHRVDPAKVRVSLPVGRSYYKKVLDRMLFQGRLKEEVRVDEAGNPLLWVSTIKN